MKKLSRYIFFAVFGAVFCLASRTGESYVRSPLSNGMPFAWNLTNPGTPKVSNGQIIYNLNPAGSDNVPFDQVAQAITGSFQTWENIPSSTVAFERGGDSGATATTNDDVLQVFWLENSTTTSDGLNLAGALAVSRITTISSGARTGEIIDGALVFNGNEFQWAIDGSTPNAVDIAEVATHEIGHLIGISHSPIGGTTMFPRSGPNRTRSRSLETDDIMAASVAYPVAGFGSSTGTIQGRVRDGGSTAIFGAHVAAVDANGNVTSGALTQPDGSYSIQGIPPGNYTLYAEPLDPQAGAYYSKSDLTSFYANINGDFSTSSDSQVSVGAGQQASLDITVQRGNPAFDAYFVFDAPNQGFLNIATTVTQGQNNVTIGVAGPGLPQSGSPLSISGSGITIIRQYFRTTTNGFQAVLADINVSATAPTGSRNIIISNGSQRTIVTGGIELAAGSGPGSTLSVVSSANFGASVAAESIASVFGTNLAATTLPATANPLPTSLGGVSVLLRDSVGNERAAPLFFISPTQINYQIAPGIVIGNTTISVSNNGSVISTGSFQLDPVAPGLFSANARGQGIAAAVALRIRNGVQTFEPIMQSDGTPIPIDLGPTTDNVFLVLFATGVRFYSSLPSCSVGGSNMQVSFAGAQGGFIGLDQINVRLDRSLIGRGSVNVLLNVDGKSSNSVDVTVK